MAVNMGELFSGIHEIYMGTSLSIHAGVEVSTGVTRTGVLIDCTKYLYKTLLAQITYASANHTSTGITITTYCANTSVGPWAELNHWSGLCTGNWALGLEGSGTYASGIQYYKWLKVLAAQEATMVGGTGVISTQIMLH